MLGMIVILRKTHLPLKKELPLLKTEATICFHGTLVQCEKTTGRQI